MKLLICGDYVPYNRTVSLNDKIDVISIFNDFLPYIQESDYTIVNLEAPIIDNLASGSRIKKTGPHLRANKSTIETLYKAGVNVVSLANNHFRDYGDEGVKSTLELCPLFNINTVGGGLNIEAAVKPLILNVGKDRNIGVLNICENEYSIAGIQFGGANPFDLINNYYQIRELRAKVDYLFLIYHGGHEGYQLPNPSMKKNFHYFIDLGVDAVVCHHAHCYSGYEIYQNKPIFYGLGNFSFDENNPIFSIWNEGFAVQFDISANIQFKIIPYMQGSIIPGVKLLNRKEQENFDKHITVLNEIISSDDLLQQNFDSGGVNHAKMYFSMLDSNNTNRIYSKLYDLGFIPRLKDKYLRLLLNLIRCESHRNMIINILEKWG